MPGTMSFGQGIGLKIRGMTKYWNELIRKAGFLKAGAIVTAEADRLRIRPFDNQEE
jgi:hypothetical protein